MDHTHKSEKNQNTASQVKDALHSNDMTEQDAFGPTMQYRTYLPFESRSPMEIQDLQQRTKHTISPALRSDRARVYTALTPRALQRHDHIQAFPFILSKDEYSNVNREMLAGQALASLGVDIELVILDQEPVGMNGIQRFEYSTTDPFYTSACDERLVISIRTSGTEQRYDAYRFAASSRISSEYGDRASSLHTYSRDVVEFALERQVDSVEYDPVLMEREIVGIGLQFHHGPFPPYVVLLCSNGDGNFEDELHLATTT